MSIAIPKKLWPCVFTLVFGAALQAQQVSPVSAPDSIQAVADTVAASRPQKRSGPDAPINYNAQTIENFVAQRITILTGKAVVKFKTATLEAGRITVEWDKNLLIAEPLPDSLGNGQASHNGIADSTASKLQGIPVFADGSERFSGEKMEYNFATERGRVLRGRTKLDDGKYFGGQIKRVDDNVLNVSHGSYSTCEIEDHPHFHFQSRRMKIIVNDKVIARPVVFYLGDIPLMIIPFAWFPIQTGRHSGLIVPRFGHSAQEGRFLRDLGYYWAINDYLDARTQVDFFELSGWYLRSSLNYNKRYAFNGNVNVSFTDKNFSYLDYTGGSTQQQRLWSLSLSHSQPIGTRASLRAQGYFVSDNSFYKNVGESRSDQLKQRLTSNATYSTNFGNGRGSLSFNVSEQRDLQNGSWQRTLPGYNFNWAQGQVFPQKIKKKKVALEEDPPWYSGLNFSFTSNGDYRFNHPSDTLKTETIGTARHGLNLSLYSPKRFFGWLYLSQSLPINEDWFDRTTDYFVQDDSALSAVNPVGSRVDKGFATRHTFSYSLSTNTKLYGTFSPRLGPVQSLRHVVTPSLTFSYQPDFSDPFWGYFEEVTLPDGSKQRFDRFGGTGRGKIAALSFAIGNLFQMKSGSEEKPKKVDLFTLDVRSGYNFAAQAFKQSNLNSALQANPGRNLSLSMSAAHSFYDYDRTTGAPVPILLTKTGGFLRLMNYGVNANLRLQGSATASAPGETAPEADREGQEQPVLPENLDERFFTGQQQRFVDNSIPWNVSIAFNLSSDQTNPLHKTKRAQLSLQHGEVRLTKNWRVGVSAQYDLVNKTVFDQQYTIYRDLHCWEMQVLWTPSGYRKGIYMRVNIKSPILRDIKVEKRGGRSSVFGGSYQ
jgi:lipopolysaccharide assembly outer membrane protein LptD (OstA)